MSSTLKVFYAGIHKYKNNSIDILSVWGVTLHANTMKAEIIMSYIIWCFMLIVFAITYICDLIKRGWKK